MRVLKSGDQFVNGLRDVFVQGEAWEDMVVGEETNGFSRENRACVGTPDVKTPVMFWVASDMPSF